MSAASNQQKSGELLQARFPRLAQLIPSRAIISFPFSPACPSLFSRALYFISLSPCFFVKFQAGQLTLSSNHPTPRQIQSRVNNFISISPGSTTQSQPDSSFCLIFARLPGKKTIRADGFISIRPASADIFICLYL